MSIVKKVRSENFNSCKISYDSFISITKLFIYNFNKLSEEEKLEFKSLNNYLKQLSKCYPNKNLTKNRKINIQKSEIPSDNNIKLQEKDSIDILSSKENTILNEVKNELIEVKNEVIEVKNEVIEIKQTVEEDKPIDIISSQIKKSKKKTKAV